MKAGELASMMVDNVDLIARHLFQNGKIEGREYRVGSLAGEEGQSLGICMSGNKAGVWSDFTTGEAGDLLDLWMKAKNLSLSDTMLEVKDYLGVEDHTPKFIANKKSFKKPAKPKNCIGLRLESKVAEYLTKERKLTPETIAKFKIADGGDSIVFPYIRDDKPVMIKTLKLARKNGKKDIKPTSAGQEPCLFGWQAISEQARAVILVEGEIDCMSINQMGFDSLSIPFGGGKGQNWIETEYDRINIFDDIYICMDNDSAGEAAKEEIIDRLGRHRCKTISLNGYKDANEALLAGFDLFDLQSAINKAQSCDPDELKQLSEFHDEIMEEFYPKNEKQMGAKLPWRKTHDFVRLRLGEISVWAGINSHGKSLVLSQVMVDCVSQGYKTCIASMEMSPADTGMKMYQQVGGVDQPAPKYANKIKEYVRDGVWVFNAYGTAKREKILDVFKYAMYRYGIKHFVVDSLAKCGIREDDYNGQKEFIDTLMEFAGQHNVHVHVVMHCRKQENEYGMPGKMDLKGTGALSDMVDNVFIMFRNKKKEKAINSTDEKKIKKYKDQPDAFFGVEKQRKSGEEKTYALWFHKPSCQFLGYEADSPIKYIL